MSIVKKLLPVNLDPSNIVLTSQLHTISGHVWFEWLFGLVLLFFFSVK